MARNDYDILLDTTIFLFYLLLFLLYPHVSSGDSDGEVLLKFKASLKNTATLANWTASQPPCSGWKGVLCDGGHVRGLQLENMGLHGVIDIGTLTGLPSLRSLSFKNNDFEGSLPNLTSHSALKTVFLSNNKFSGEIPATTFNGMQSLKKLHLSNNKLSGTIPATLARLPKLIELMVQDNEFEGEIPNFQQQGLKTFNASNNRLAGQIPQSLRHLDASSFSGNKDLCGAPLEACSSAAASKDDSDEGHHRQFPTIIVVSILVGAAVIALLAVCIFFVSRRKRSAPPQQAGETAAAAGGGGAASDAAAAMSAAGDLNRMERGAASGDQGGKQGVKLTFLKEETERFEMQELLKATAEVLGSSVFGTTYKAALNGKMMVVKRFKQMNQVSKEEFNEHMRRLGRMSHQNLHPIVAFYYKKEEKLLVTEFAHNVSLNARLHGHHHRSLDWTTRLKIVKGVAKGLLYLHNEQPTLTPPHGHLKASNVLLDAAFNPLLTDYGLIPIVNKEPAQQHMVAFKSPEYTTSAKLAKKTDVWSFGLLVLEILTRKKSSLEDDSGVDLATWVQSADDSAAAFDEEMAGTSHSRGEMMKLLNIGMSCCQADVESRPDIKEVVEKVEEIKEKEFDDDFYSTYASESDMRSSRGLSEDFKSINI